MARLPTVGTTGYEVSDSHSRRRMRSEALLTENRAMTGIQFVTDEKGLKVAVQIDLKKHQQLWEEIEDVLISRSRRHEKRIPLAKVKAGLIKSGKLPA
jgi:hypothetical protein